MTTMYSRHADLRLTAVDDEGVVLHLGSLRYFTVNETGLIILQELMQPRSLPELVKAVTDAYDVTTEVAEQTTRAFVARWRGRLSSAGGRGRIIFGVALIVVALLILTGADRLIEGIFVELSPDWLNDLTTSV